MNIVTRQEYMAAWLVWTAIDDATYDLDSPVGYGETEQEAIENLLMQIEVAE